MRELDFGYNKCSRAISSDAGNVFGDSGTRYNSFTQSPEVPAEAWGGLT